MQGIDLYTFFLCLIVFLLLTGVFTFLIVVILKMGITLTLSGHSDEEIINSHRNPVKKSKFNIIETGITLLICLLFIIAFSFSVFVNVQDDKYFENIPTVNVVRSSSMAKKNPKNTYLTEFNLNNQFSTFDLILVYKVPPANELKKYDIVLYETDDLRVIHRIIDIEPPNEVHPEEYWFTCKGDSVDNIDRFPVRYNQIKAIYRNEKIPFVGSFISFLQSPAGILCIILVVLGMIAAPITEKKIKKAEDERYAEILDIIAEAKLEKQELELEKQKEKEYMAQLTAELERLKAAKLERENAAADTVQKTELTESSEQEVFTTEVSESLDTESFSATEQIEESEGKPDPFAHLANKGSKTFRQKLRRYKDVRVAFTELKTYIETFERIRLIESDRHDTFKRGNLPVARFAIRGKTLYTYLALPPSEFSDTKYIFTDVSDKSAYKNYPMLVKITSQRQLRWARELIDEIAKRRGLVRKAAPVSLTAADIEKAAEELLNKLNEENEAELSVRHEELNNRNSELESRHEALQARHSELESRDEELQARHSELKSRHEALQAREEELKKREEELQKLLESEKKDRFAHLANKNTKTFRQKLRKFKEARAAFTELKSYIEAFEKIRLIESDKHDTFKRGNLPVARFTIRGKTLYAYLALPPKEFIHSKYIFTDVSDKPSYRNYPMLIKLTSDRQLRWTKELIDIIAKNSGLVKK